MPDDIQLGASLTCFIISPIGNRLEPVGSPGRSRYEESIRMWEEVVEPAAQTFGLSPVRADRISDTGEIPDQIFTYLRNSDVVIADLSHANPNVMYELGLRHSLLGKVTIQIGEYETLPFDVTTIRTIQFNRTPAGLISARDELIAALRTALSGGGSPLRASVVFGGDANVAVDVNSDVQRSVAPESGEDTFDEPGTIDILAESEEGLQHIGEVLVEAGAIIGEQFSSIVQDATARMQDQGSATFAARLLIARELSAALAGPAERFSELGNQFYSDVNKTDALIQYTVERWRTGAEDPSEETAQALIKAVGGMVDSSEEAAIGITNFRDSSKGLAKTSRDLGPASRQLSGGADRFLEGIGIMSRWREQLEAYRVADES